MEPTQEYTPDRHICGVCNDEWLTEEEYLAHTCPGTNFTPTDPQHLVNSTTPDFIEVSGAALQRGLETAQASGDEAQVAKNQEAITQLTSDTPEQVANPTPEQVAPEQPPIQLQ